MRWWQHPLFGDLLGLPPPEIPRSWARRMTSLDEVFQSPRLALANHWPTVEALGDEDLCCMACRSMIVPTATAHSAAAASRIATL
jgi:hypothetical protein